MQERNSHALVPDELAKSMVLSGDLFCRQLVSGSWAVVGQ